MDLLSLLKETSAKIAIISPPESGRAFRFSGRILDCLQNQVVGLALANQFLRIHSICKFSMLCPSFLGTFMGPPNEAFWRPFGDSSWLICNTAYSFWRVIHGLLKIKEKTAKSMTFFLRNQLAGLALAG